MEDEQRKYREQVEKEAERMAKVCVCFLVFSGQKTIQEKKT